MKKLLATIWLNLISYSFLVGIIYGLYNFYMTEPKMFVVIIGVFVGLITTIVSIKVLEKEK